MAERALSSVIANNLQGGPHFLLWNSHPLLWVFKWIQLCCYTAQPIYHSNLCKCHSSIQLYVSCILRSHSSWGLCKANLSWINQEIPWCMLYVEEDILFRSRREVLPSLRKWTNPLSVVYLYTFQNTSKYVLGPLRLLSADTEDSRSIKDQFDHLRLQSFSSQKPGKEFC